MRRAFLTSVLIASVVIPLQGIADEPFGRLFFTPAQRSALDAGKQVRTRKAPSAPAIRGPREVTLNGVVTRSDGESTVWVNGRALSKQTGDISAQASAADPASAQVKPAGARNNVRLRVGQHLESSSGKISEPYLRVGSERPAASAKPAEVATPIGPASASSAPLSDVAPKD